jgi:hypothetical protein
MTTLDHAAPGPLAAADWQAPSAVDRLQRNGLIAAAVGILGCAAGFLADRPVFFRAYLVAWVFAVGVTLGCLAIAMLHHVSRGGWGLLVRRALEAASRTLPLLLLLALPLAFGMRELYPWARPELVAHDSVLQAKTWWLSVPFFWARLVVYFVVWGALAFVLNRLSLEQDRTGDPRLVRRMQLIAAPGLAVYCLTATLASVDWLMSLQPHWFSTIYGIYFIGGQGLAAIAFMIVIARFLARREPMARVLSPHYFHDYGKLMLAFVMLWAYFCFSQFLIIWAGNEPEEIVWYVRRIRHGWGWFALGLVLFHFALPFALLLSRGLKRNARLLGAVALAMLAMRWVDLFWQTEPAFHDGTFAISWQHPAALLAVGGLWFAAFLHELKKRPLLPINDPYLPEAIAHEGH